MWDENGNLARQLTCVKKEKKEYTRHIFCFWGGELKPTEVKPTEVKSTCKLLNFILKLRDAAHTSNFFDEFEKALR